MKYVHKDGHLYLKLTDDVRVSDEKSFSFGFVAYIF